MQIDHPDPPFLNAFSFSVLTEDAFSTQNIILLLVILCLIIGSALVSGSEIAFFSFKSDHLRDFKTSKSKQERNIYKLLSQPRYLLATILIANNFFNIGIIIVSFYLLNSMLDFSGVTPAVEVMINSVLVTFLIVLFGEVIPKVYATQKARNLAGFMSKPLLLTKDLLQPFSRLLIKTTSLVEEKIKAKGDEGLNADEVDLAIDLTTKGKANQEEIQMLKSIVRFGDIAVKDVMTSRPDIHAVSEEMDFNSLMYEIRKSGFSRIPVYEEDLDHITGILYAKDLLAYIDNEEEFKWQALIRDGFYVPENKKIDDLLEDFQSNRMHIALVVDEYGGTAGLITLEDVLEEIIGEIKDEFDDIEEEIDYKQITANKYIFEGKVSLFDMCKIIGADFTEFEEVKGESDSLGGLVLELSSKIPDRHQKIEYGNYIFTVVDVDQKRIKKIDVEKV